MKQEICAYLSQPGETIAVGTSYSSSANMSDVWNNAAGKFQFDGQEKKEK